MTEQADITSDAPPHAGNSQRDITGRDQMVSNVLFSWGSHLVFVVAGFIMPRMIDSHLGQELLGVWDFGWSLVAYFTLVNAGINSSINRYVAKHYGASDISGVSDVASSGFCVLGLAAVVVFGLTIGVFLLIPTWFGERLADNVREAQWVFFYLGMSLVCDTAFSPFVGVITGCHRWKIHNLIKSGWHLVSVTGMITVLLAGGSLVNLAQVYLAGQVFADATRVICAHRACPGLRVNPFRARGSTVKSMYAFGGKTMIPILSRLLAAQTTNILIVAYLGPAALALFSRPMALTLHIATFANKLAFVLTPTVSSLQSTDNHEEIRALLLKAVGYCCHLSLPLVLVLIVFGGPILQLWMGEDYADDLLPAILALGSLAMMINRPLWSIALGLNAHGRLGVAQLIASLCSVGLIALALGVFDLGLVGVAAALAIPLITVNTLYLPLCVCRRLGLPIRDYVESAVLRPAVHVLPFAACLVGARFLLNINPLIELAWGLAAGGTILTIIFWRHVLPDRLKVRLARIVPAYRSAT